MALIAITLFVFAPVRSHEFLSFDDPDYVTSNAQVQAGVTGPGLAWAFTTTQAGNWHPITWVSHMIDADLYGSNAGGHHATSVAIHVINVLLLFGLLARITGQPGRSGFVAALFAVHPLHVESVAWVAERKDVLSTFFWLATLWAYVAYVRRPRLGRYLAVVGTFALGLMAKPMLVTLPFTLLLLDVWPLGRAGFGLHNGDTTSRKTVPWTRLVVEKIPLFVLVAAASAVTLLAQRANVRTLTDSPFSLRVANALRSYAVYLIKTIWPSGLEVFYPFPPSIPLWVVAGSAIGLAAVSVLAFRALTTRPYIFTGWFWYLGTLVPVIGLMQVGRQAMADRYMYVPSIGLFIILAWGVPELLARWRAPSALPIAAVGVTLACIVTAQVQVRTWENNVTLWEHALRVDPGNATAYYFLGTTHVMSGELADGIRHIREAVRLDPNMTEGWSNLGTALTMSGQDEEAVAAHRKALTLAPGDPAVRVDLGRALVQVGRNDEAMRLFEQVLATDGDSADAHAGLGVALARGGRVDEAVRHFQLALRANPSDALTHAQLGSALESRGEVPAAIQQYAEAVRYAPDRESPRLALGAALSKVGRHEEAIREFLVALEIAPGDPEAHYNLAIAYLAAGNARAARQQLEQTLAIRPEHGAARRALTDLVNKGGE